MAETEFPDGSRYTGDLDPETSQKHGFGTWHFPANHLHVGCYYTGQFENDQQNGQGTLYYPNHNKWYSGGFLNNLRHGEGTLYWNSGLIWYSGSWANDQRSGSGTEYFRGEETQGEPEYTGQFSDNKYSGTGQLYYHDHPNEI